MATYSQIVQGSFTSGGLVYDLQLPLTTTSAAQPTLVKLELFNYTKWATASKKIESRWFYGMPAASALITATTGGSVYESILEVTNGFTLVNDTARFGVECVSITKANPGVVTFRGPGFSPGQGISSWATGDRFKFGLVQGTQPPEWAALNGVEFYLNKVSANTFTFGLTAGSTTDTSAYTGTYVASTGSAYRTVDVAGRPIPVFNVANVGVRLGTAVVGEDGDVQIFVAYFSDDSRALGDIGA